MVGSLSDRNAIVVDMGERNVLPVVKDTPVIAGVNGTDPTRVMSVFLDKLPPMGFSGVINFPSHGIIDGRWRQSLEATGFGYNREVDVIKLAREKDIFTLSYCFTPDEAARMTRAGVDVVVAHMGLTTGGSIGAATTFALSVDDCVGVNKSMADAARSVREDVLIVTHGGPLESPEDAARVIHGANCHGFIGASTMGAYPSSRRFKTPSGASNRLL